MNFQKIQFQDLLSTKTSTFKVQYSKQNGKETQTTKAQIDI